ncbi:putative membrane protein [Xanthomonas bromi]|uniref:Putative membrane protein n=1 Tax=Xanthomonas bromi TaxID=56449 RepID=A0A1C3NSG3_9XANT|nr:putative type VI secretion system effector [Xanthomonas bromi]PPV04057.1 hypothetical protein XbrCFBP1976_21410 [Xanthomonas bromi]SBV53342.1 putative membrane protein [Xanthomonas bromi]
MDQNSNAHFKVLSGTLRNVIVTNTTSETLFREGEGERDEMATACLAAMPMEDKSEPVCQVSFELDGKNVVALLWNWPFKEGDEVKAVVEPVKGFGYIAFAVLDTKENIIVLYPHVSMGRGRAHWVHVYKKAIIRTCSINLWAFMAVFVLYWLVDTAEFKKLLIAGLIWFLVIFIMCVRFGYKSGYRFTPFVEMAENIFTALGWRDVRDINLQNTTKAKKKPNDPPAMGESYFRY